jgi:hypothetical protein
MPPQQRQRAQVAVELVSLAVSLAGMAAAVWLTLPPQQRMWIRLAVAGRVRSSAAMMAWRQGHSGMGEEIRTGQRSIRYLAAWGLSTVRDRASTMLEAMRP